MYQNPEKLFTIQMNSEDAYMIEFIKNELKFIPHYVRVLLAHSKLISNLRDYLKNKLGVARLNCNKIYL